MNHFLCAWAATDKLTFLRYQKFKAYFGDLETAWQKADELSLAQIGLEPKVVAEILDAKEKIHPVEEMEKLLKQNIVLIDFLHSDYPLLLKEISSPPVFLYVKGKIKADETCLAVVGARQITNYGKQVTESLVGDLARNGLTIVSGLALGTDSLAHQTALNAQTRTIAILGNGLDRIYPAYNHKLAEKIFANGAIVSEFPLGTPPNHYNFPRRNRIIAGMSLGVLVIEARLKSGSLITARNAIEQNREVFAVPGSIYNQKSEGTNYLIQQGEAKLVQKAEDILEELNLNLVRSRNAIKNLPDISGLNVLEKEILNMLGKEPVLFDELKNELNLDTAEICTILTLLEMKGLALNLGNNQWVKSF